MQCNYFGFLLSEVKDFIKYQLVEKATTKSEGVKIFCVFYF